MWHLDSLFPVVNMKLEFCCTFTTQTCKMIKSCCAFERFQMDICGKPEAGIWGRQFSVACELRFALNNILLAECSVSTKFCCERQVPSLDCTLHVCVLLCLIQQRKSIF